MTPTISSGFDSGAIELVSASNDEQTADFLLRIFVPYKGSQQALLDTISGQTSMNIAPILTTPDVFEAYVKSEIEMLLIAPAFAINSSLHGKLPFDPNRDFTGVTQLVDSNNHAFAYHLEDKRP